ETLCDGTTERDVVETFVRESSRIPEWLKEMGAEIVPRARGLPARVPISDPAPYPFVGGADGVGPRVRVKGVTESGGIDLWGILSRNVANKHIEVLYSSPVKHLAVEKGVGVTGVVAEKGDK